MNGENCSGRLRRRRRRGFGPGEDLLSWWPLSSLGAVWDRLRSPACGSGMMRARRWEETGVAAAPDGRSAFEGLCTCRGLRRPREVASAVDVLAGARWVVGSSATAGALVALPLVFCSVITSFAAKRQAVVSISLSAEPAVCTACSSCSCIISDADGTAGEPPVGVACVVSGWDPAPSPMGLSASARGSLAAGWSSRSVTAYWRATLAPRRKYAGVSESCFRKKVAARRHRGLQ